MSLTLDQAKQALSAFYTRHFSPSIAPTWIDDDIQGLIGSINWNGNSVEVAYAKEIGTALSAFRAKYHISGQDPFPTAQRDYVGAVEPETVPSAALVDYFYPNASAAVRAELIQALDADTLTNNEFVIAWSLFEFFGKTTPTAQDIFLVDQQLAAGSLIYDFPATLPDVGLGFAGVTDGQLDFLVTMYIGAFNRAPEYDGLRYWANKLAGELAGGKAATAAFKAVSTQMYIDGKGNGEGGTSLSPTDYVDFVYQNALGRPADPSGKTYWTNKLVNEGLPAGEFLASILSDALQNTDAGFLQARVAVAKFVAQPHVSYPATKIGIEGLVNALAGVHNTGTAAATIQQLTEQFGTAASPKAGVAAMSLDFLFGGSLALGDALGADDASGGSAEVVLVGVTGVDAIDSMGL